jgi:hypothetical protein
MKKLAPSNQPARLRSKVIARGLREFSSHTFSAGANRNSAKITSRVGFDVRETKHCIDHFFDNIAFPRRATLGMGKQIALAANAEQSVQQPTRRPPRL